MSFLDRINEITKPKTFTVKFDFGAGDGEEDVTFRRLSQNERQKIMQDRFEIIGKNEKGQDVIGIPPKCLAVVNAEILAASFIRSSDDPKPVATKSDFLEKWDSDLVDRLAQLCMNTVMLNDKRNEDDDEDPSKGES